MLTHRNLVCNHLQFSNASRLGPDDCYIVYLPLSHIYGAALMGMGMMTGLQQIILERFDLTTHLAYRKVDFALFAFSGSGLGVPEAGQWAFSSLRPPALFLQATKTLPIPATDSHSTSSHFRTANL